MIKRQKVILCITKGTWGGAQKNVFDIVVSLPKDKFDVAVVYGTKGILVEKLVHAGIRTIEVADMERDISLVREWRSFIAMVHILRQEKPDILHTHSPKAGGLGALAGRITGVPRIIYTVHGWTFNEDRPWWQKILIYFFSWLTIVLNHTIITIASKETAQAQNFPFSGKKIIEIPNGIRVPDFLPQEEARAVFEQKINEDLRDAVVVGSIGELHKNKGYEYAMEAFATLSKHHPFLKYVIVGEGEERVHLQKIVRHKNLQNTVFFAGYMDNAAVGIKAFDTFLMPSIKEGLPYVLLEAGAAQVPSIATRVGGIPELIENTKEGMIIPPGSSKEIVRAIEWAIDNRPILQNCAERLYEKIQKNHTLETMMARLMRVYTK
jgi:glycosyltransferase involved in cell wall biosynthesis